ncbi:MAG: hypothetical protein HYT07_03375 [Candidatus Levybacteria bacterium]|nr:hypothetical protein [Candidatus Levybacteria bacterium]
MNDDQKTGQNKNDASNAGMQNQPQAQGVGFHNKEHGALGSPLSEVMQLSEAEPNVSEELRGIGVKANNTSFEFRWLACNREGS